MSNRKGDETFNWADSKDTTFGQLVKGDYFFHDKRLHLRSANYPFRGTDCNCAVITGDGAAIPTSLPDDAPVIHLVDCKVRSTGGITMSLNKLNEQYESVRVIS